MTHEKVLPLNNSIHRTVQELLPWFVVGTLKGDEQAMVQEHLQNCTECRSDVDWQRKLQAMELPATSAPDVERALARLRPRLDAQPRAKKPAARAGFLQTFFAGNAPWMRWALATQFAVIAVLGILVVPPLGDLAAYRVLGAGTPANTAGNAVVIFRPETTVQDMRRILQASGARVVDGPTVTDAYVLAVTEKQLAHAIGALRAEPAVAMAEPLGSGGVR